VLGPLTEWPTTPPPYPRNARLAGGRPGASPYAREEREGVTAYFYRGDIGRIWRIAEGLDYGIVGMNEGIISTARGEVRASLFACLRLVRGT